MDAQPTPHLRRGVPDDAAGIAAVQVASWRAGYRGLLPDDLLAGLSVEKRTESWTGYLAEGAAGRTFVALDHDDTVRGFATAGRSRDDDAAPDIGELWALYTHPDAWRRGVGSALMTTVKTDLRAGGYEQATLWVLTANDRARRFYESHGWRVEGRTQVDGERHEVRYELGC